MSLNNPKASLLANSSKQWSQAGTNLFGTGAKLFGTGMDDLLGG
jgi:hypothetical protein